MRSIASASSHDRAQADLKPRQFHADNLSSAHVYLRLKPGQQWDNLPAVLVEDCAQLTKANSIEGRLPLLMFDLRCGCTVPCGSDFILVEHGYLAKPICSL